MVHLVSQVGDDLAAAIDELVRAGRYASREDAVRAGLERLVVEARRASAGEEIVRGYAACPETDEELELAHQATLAMIEEEPW